MNIPLLKRVKAAILKHPRQFEMRGWFSCNLMFVRKPSDSQPGGCGTAACIAGWACHITGGKKRISETSYSVCNAGNRAATELQLLSFQRNRLFIVACWPDQFNKRYENARTPKTRARAAADRINHFIKTKGAE